MNGFYYVYFLRSVSSPDCHYVGFTEDLQKRLHTHNSGHVPHTSKFTPWTVKSATAFRDRDRALAFERYLKTASGRAFSRKRL